MPRYFFDLVDDKSVYDKKGVTLPNEKAAREHAITFARELMETRPELLGEIMDQVVGAGLQRQIRSDPENPLLQGHWSRTRRRFRPQLNGLGFLHPSHCHPSPAISCRTAGWKILVSSP